MAWATWTALHAVVMHAVMRWHVLKGGVGPVDFMDNAAIRALVISVLPHQAKFIEELGPAGYYLLLEELETKLLTELQATLVGKDADNANVEQASEIVRRANDLFRPTDELEPLTSV
jgi:hypothetical protein